VRCVIRNGRKQAVKGGLDGRHQAEYRDDLNPNAMAGQNIGASGEHPEKGAATAYDIKPLHARFSDWADDDLKQIPIMPRGSRLEQNATYIDLAAAALREITATGDMEATSGHWYAPKSEVPYELWNRLLGLQDVDRTGIATTN
jgi:hypothetical protein